MNATSTDPLIAKYDVAGPRYTSYPTVPYWERTPTEQTWIERIAHALGSSKEASAALYLHIPFCRSLCTYCGCNTRITRSHSIVTPYIQFLLTELDLYLRHLQPRGIIAFHVSNLYLDLVPVVERLAQARQLATCLVEADTEDDFNTASSWVLVSPDPQVLTQAQIASVSQAIAPNATRVWTDDYSDQVPYLQ